MHVPYGLNEVNTAACCPKLPAERGVTRNQWVRGGVDGGPTLVSIVRFNAMAPWRPW